MDIGRVLVLREVLATSGWVERTQSFARTMRRSTKEPGGLLLVGTPDSEPWHLAAHLDDEARFTGVELLSPTLIRYQAPRNAPAHLSVTLQRLEQAKRGETVFVVSDEDAPSSLLERTWDAKKAGATILSLDAGDKELEAITHESLTVVRQPVLPITSEATDPSLAGELAGGGLMSSDMVTFDTVQHLVSVAAGEAARDRDHQSLRNRLGALLESISGPRFDPDK